MSKTSRAGVSDTRAGLQPAGLYSSAGIFKKGFQDFHPLDASPYLLFDASKSMVGTLENPTLDLDPSKTETLDVITATRSGVATYTDADGVIKQAASDTVRVDYVDGVPMILVEPSATNLVEYSEDFSQWASSNSTLNAAQTTAPDNTLNGSSLQINSGGYFYVTIASSHGVGDSVTFSCFVKSPLQKLTWGGATANGTDVYSYEDVGNGWYRQILTRTFSATGSLQPMFTEAQAGSDLFYIWGAQVETGSVATSYIPTSGGDTAARTRAADDLEITGSDFSDFFNSGGDGTFYVEFTTRNILDPQTFILVGNSGSIRYFYTNATDPRLLAYDGTFSSFFGQGSIQTTLNRASMSYNSSTTTSSLNGSTDASVSHSGSFSNATELNIGSSYEDALHLNGHFRRILYWPYSSDRL